MFMTRVLFIYFLNVFVLYTGVSKNILHCQLQNLFNIQKTHFKIYIATDLFRNLSMDVDQFGAITKFENS